ncbi:MAG: TonB-dependent receptor plug domain-containing protein [Burkholderiales bacterium]
MDFVRCIAATACVLAAAWAASAQAQAASRGELADLSLEELANLEVTSVSRRAERLSDAPASIFVITGDDIRRSGATSLPEALRLAPNLQVARVDARQYAISARGFNSTAAAKLLVLIDGRTVYTPLFSGVFWDAQDTLLEDIERIEVISGAGGTLWGTNAVNGVINIITKRATDTQGTLAYAGGGNEEAGLGARHGLRLDNGGGLRVYGKGFSRDSTVRASGADVPDQWHSGQAGFRADWGAGSDSYTFQGDAYQGKADQTAPGDVSLSGGNVLFRWDRQLAGGDRVHVQAYFDNTQRDIPGTFAERLDTYDVEFQHALSLGSDNLLTWGGGHRFSKDSVTNTTALAFLPADRDLKWTNVFAQDEYRWSDALRLTAGARVEHNPYTGTEWLPSARLAWRIDPARLAWAAASRAVRAPSRIDREFFVPGQPPFTVLAGGPDFRSEISNVFEIGYRAQPSARASYSVTAFRSLHEHQRTVEPGPQGPVIGNGMEGESTGLEAWGKLQVTPRWRLSAGGTLLDQDLRLAPGSGATGVSVAGNDPKRQFSLRSSHDLGAAQELDVIVRYVSALPDPPVRSYTAFDARYSWRVRAGLELSVSVQNLFDDRHLEFFGSGGSRAEIERGVFVKAVWQP